jgi:hypothetical protein
MTRTIRPLGKVTPALKRHGYRQQAAIFVDGEQVPNTLVLSIKVDDKLRFEGHYIDANGELHKTNKFADMKRAAARIMTIREFVLAEQAPAPKPAAKPPASDAKAVRRARRAAKRQPGGDRLAGSDNLIDCSECNTIHRADSPCL